MTCLKRRKKHRDVWLDSVYTKVIRPGLLCISVIYLVPYWKKKYIFIEVIQIDEWKIKEQNY